MGLTEVLQYLSVQLINLKQQTYFTVGVKEVVPGQLMVQQHHKLEVIHTDFEKRIHLVLR
jgi:hypothetical protein